MSTPQDRHGDGPDQRRRDRDDERERERGHDRDEGEQDLGLDEIDVRDALRKALAPPGKREQSDVLTGVQQRIRERSAGKFYANGWTTSTSPRATFLVTSVVMLVVVVLAWLLLSPSDFRIVP